MQPGILRHALQCAGELRHAKKGRRTLHAQLDPAAVAHHAEEDFGQRYDDPAAATAVKNAESLALAAAPRL
mgnify:CR=1 FL=1